jgi:hypothetical protein
MNSGGKISVAVTAIIAMPTRHSSKVTPASNERFEPDKERSRRTHWLNALAETRLAAFVLSASSVGEFAVENFMVIDLSITQDTDDG